MKNKARAFMGRFLKRLMIFSIIQVIIFGAYAYASHRHIEIDAKDLLEKTFTIDAVRKESYLSGSMKLSVYSGGIEFSFPVIGTKGTAEWSTEDIEAHLTVGDELTVGYVANSTSSKTVLSAASENTVFRTLDGYNAHMHKQNILITALFAVSEFLFICIYGVFLFGDGIRIIFSRKRKKA